MDHIKSSPLARALASFALLLVWALPASRLAVLPQERALAVAEAGVCRAGQRTVVLPEAWSPALPRVSFSIAPSGTETDLLRIESAAPFQPAATRQWATELLHLMVVALALAALAAGWRLAPLWVIAAVVLFISVHEPRADAYRLLWVAESPRLWWQAISQWSLSLWAERLVAPAMAGVSLLVAVALLLQAWTRGAPRWIPMFFSINPRRSP
jgi:uncharacterized membrane protein